jgi:hypothetical protein
MTEDHRPGADLTQGPVEGGEQLDALFGKNPWHVLNLRMYRVLRTGGRALIIDLRSDASAEALDAYVQGLGLDRINTVVTKLIFQHSLVKSAYSQEQFRQMAGATRFATCEVRVDTIGLAVSLTK